MARSESTPEDLEASRDARLARQRLVRQERYLTLLRLAYRTRCDSGLSLDKITQAIAQGENELEGLQQLAGGRIVGRRRPPKIETGGKCTILVDECGAHHMTAKDAFTSFVLAGVIIRDNEYARLDRKWKRWKSSYLGSATKRVHEPDIRDRRKSFWCGGGRKAQDRAITALSRWLARADFKAIACVIDRPEYLKQYGADALDESLPQHPYLMTVHFLAERAALALYNDYRGALGKLVVESRGPLEDANFQYEFTRLFLDGTSYVSATMFRQQLEPGIEFLSKDANNTGLQLADLVARPCGDKVMHLESTPGRWPEVKTKLVQGRETLHSIVGMKIVPWDERYSEIWQS